MGRARRAMLGMNLWEMLLVMTAIAVTLGLLSGASNTLRSHNAQQQTINTLRSLRLALDQYHQSTGAFPPEPFSVAVHYLQANPSSATHMQALKFTTNSQGFTTLADGYGRAITYNHLTIHGQYAPDFISAGPDGQFGDLTSTNTYKQQAVIDNVTGASTGQPSP